MVNNLLFEKIDKLLRDKKLSTESFSNKIGMTRASWVYMKKHKTIKVSTLIKIAEVLNVDPIYFLAPDKKNPGEFKKNPQAASLDLDHCRKMLGYLEELISSKNQLIDRMEKDIERLEENLKKKKSKPNAA